MNTKYEIPLRVTSDKKLRGELSKIFGLHPDNVCRSLSGATNHELARKIRYVAVKEYGAVTLESEPKAGVRKWTGYWMAAQRCMVFDFGGGRELRHYEDTAEAVLIVDEAEVDRQSCTVLEADAWAKEISKGVFLKKEKK